MADFFRTQMDYVLFSYGFSLILLASLSYLLNRRPQGRLPWKWLGLFGVTQGLNAWLDLLALDLWRGLGLDLARLALITASWVFLVEFGRAGVLTLRGRGPGRGVLAALLGVVLLGGMAGMAGLFATSRYVLGLVGGLWAAGALYLAAKTAGPKKLTLWGAALGMAAYALTTGLVVTPAPFFPAALINATAFFTATGVPIDAVAGILVFWTAICLACFGQASLEPETEPRLRGWRRTWLCSTPATVFALLLAGWLATQYFGRAATKEIRTIQESHAKLLSLAIQDDMRETDNLASTLAASPWMVPALENRDSRTRQQANLVLDRYSTVIPGAVGYLLNRDGLVIAASKRRQDSSSVGQSYKFRPYFQQAMQGEPGQYWGRGVTSKEMDYYASYPVQAPTGQVVGVAVFKHPVSIVQRLFPPQGAGFVVDSQGIVVMANQPDKILRSLWPLSREIREQLLASRQFGPGPFNPVLSGEPADRAEVRFQGKRYLVLRQPFPWENWSTVILMPLHPIILGRLLGIILTLLLGSGVIGFLTIMGLTLDAASRLQSSEKRYRGLYESLRDGYAAVDLEGRITESNPEFRNMLGYTAAELGRLTYRDITPEQWHPVEAKIIEEQVFLRGYSDLFEKEYRHRDGTVFPVELQAYLNRDPQGRPAGMWALVRDITERQRAEAALRQTNETMRATLDAAPVAIFDLDLEGRVRSRWNTAAEQMLGWRADEVLGQFLPSVMEESQEEFAGFRAWVRSGKAIMGADVVRRRKDGSRIEYSIYAAPEYDDHGEVIGNIAVLVDITERKRTEAALAEEAIRRRILVEQSRDGIVVLDQTGKVYEANQRYADLLGYSAEEVRHLHIWDWDAQWSREELLEQLRRVDAAGDHFETRHRRKDGTFLDVEISTNGAVLGGQKLVFCVCRDISARKQAEAALRESEEKYHLVFDHAPLGIMHYDPASAITDCNEKFEEIIGAPKEQFIGFNMIRQLRDEKMRAAVAASLQGETGYYEGDYTSVTAGKVTPVRAIFQPILSPEGVLSGGVVIFEDITARQQAEAALSQSYRELQETTQQLEQSRNMLQLIIESAPVRVFWKDKDLRFLGCNALFARDAGFSHPQELLGKDDFGMGWRAEADLYRADDRQVMESRRPKMNIIEPQTTPTGDKIWLNTSKVPLQMTNGEVLGVLGVYEDITVRHAAEEMLRITRENLELALKGADLGTWDWDLKTGAVTFNERWARMLGYRLDEVESHYRTWEKFVHPDDLPAAQDMLNAHLEGKTPFYEAEFRMRHKSGAWVWVLDKGKIIERDAQGQPVRACGTHLDITERQRAAVERLHFSKLESLSTLAGGIAHDFNNILTAILGNISLAKLDEYEGPRLADAEQACLQAKALAQQLLTFAKGGAPIKKLFSVSKLITETGSFACRGAKVRCDFSFPDDLWTVCGDSSQLGQVFQNLVINALQAMPTGGVIKIQGENLEVEAGGDLPLDPGQYVKISIQDQGLGIPNEYLTRIFDPYFTTKQSGSGLGLATAYSIIKAHQGHIAVESTMGAGTTFQVYLPATAGKLIELPKSDQGVIRGQGKILVMDDEELVREIIAKMLKHLGYEVTVAGDGAEAVKLFTQARQSGPAFDAVILDLTIPGGMGGKAALEKLRHIDPQVKAIVSSGYSEDAIMADFAQHGFSGVIAKPYRIAELSVLLHKVIGKGHID